MAKPMMQMPLVLPLFLQDEQFASTIVLVNGSAESRYADVALTGLDGKEINHRRVKFAPHSQRAVEVRHLLQEVASPAVMGRITIMQSPDLKGMASAAQLSITYQGSVHPTYIHEEKGAVHQTYIDEETAMPSAEGSQILRAVADRAAGSPIVAVTSLTGVPQHVVIECLLETGASSPMTVELGAGQTIVAQSCENRQVSDFGAVWADLNGKSDRAVGVSLTSDATPGSFAAFALAPHKKGNDRYFSAVNFTDPKMIGSTSTIFAGVPIGSSSLLPEAKYVPQVAITNFSARALRVRIQYAQTTGDSPAVENAKDLTLPAISTK